MRLSFNKILIDIKSSRGDFIDYLDRLYGSLRVPEDTAKPHVDISVTWAPEPSDFKNRILAQRDYDWKKVGAQTFIAQRACLYNEKIDKRHTQIFLREDDQRLTFEICRQSKPFGDFFRKDIEDQWREWTYYFVLFPLFYYAERFQGLHPLHAALVVFCGKNIVIAGLENTGKTSLALEMARQGKTLILSDNLCFHDNDRVYPCYQPIKKRRGDDIASRPLLQAAPGTRHREYFYPDASLVDGYTPDFLILPCFARHAFAKKLTGSEAARFIFNANFLVSELNKYFSSAQIWNFGLDADPLTTVQKDRLTHLASMGRCYQVGISPQEPVQETVNRIQHLLGS